ncbi:hypothetical protein FS837_003451 [Tulasnella sp. UAMH 9824]|nr:hypothetical protein FS837_003451 [Tulasnella sp. UAMH 9824]
MTTRLSERLTTLPDIPKQPGEDGGHFYRHYDELADELDEELVKNLKAQLDGILIFAGLFAGVNTAFLALTLPQLSANPADDANALLLQIALGGNGSITSAADLPSASFTPPSGIYRINVLFSVSLILALLSSFLATLGQQWIVYYRKRGGGGPEQQRWEQLLRYLGAQRWQFELVLDDLVPSLLQLGLVIFCIAFALYIGTLNQSLNHIITRLLCVAAGILLAVSICAAFAPWCPFKMPLSRIVRYVASAVVAGSVYAGLLFVLLAAGVVSIAPTILQQVFPSWGSLVSWKFKRQEFYDILLYLTREFISIYRLLNSMGMRFAGNTNDLKVAALRRIVCTSEDSNTLIYAAINLQAIRDQHALCSLSKDKEVLERLSSLLENSLSETSSGRITSGQASITSRVLSTSFCHIVFSTSSSPEFWPQDNKFEASTDMEYISFAEMDRLYQGSIGAFNTSCDRCSHCAPLLFSIRVVYSLVQSTRNHSLPHFDSDFSSMATGTPEIHDSRLGFMVASVILSSVQWSYGWPFRDRLLKAVLTAYQEKSELKMFATMSEALSTVTDQWRGKPNHEIYVWLFELCLLPGRKEISAFSQHPILERVDDHLISIERRIRGENASETDRQHGRDYQNRYVRYLWTLIGSPLERYLGSVAKLMEADPGHPENPRTILVLRYMKSSFPAPELLEDSQDPAWHKRKHEREKKAYARFCQLIDYVESIRARKVYEAAGLRDRRFYCIQQCGRMWYNQQEPAIHMLAI